MVTWWCIEAASSELLVPLVFLALAEGGMWAEHGLVFA